MQTILIAIGMSLLTGFSSGYYASHKIDQSTLMRMEDSIKMANAEATTSLIYMKKRLDEAQQRANESNQQLERSHEKFIKDNTILTRKLYTAKLYDPGREGGKCTVPEGGNTELTGQRTDTGELSGELAEFLKKEALRADHTAELYDKCHQFVKIDNCGILK